MNTVILENETNTTLRPAHDIGELAGDVMRNTPAYRHLLQLGDCIQWGGMLDENSYRIADALESKTDGIVFLHVIDSKSYAMNRGFTRIYTVGIRCDCSAMAYTKSKEALIS